MADTETILGTMTEDEYRHLRKAFAIGYTKAAINRAIVLQDCTWLPEIMKLIEEI